MCEEKQEKPKNIVLEVQSLRHTLSGKILPPVKKEKEND
jgi:hypothetical protein